MRKAKPLPPAETLCAELRYRPSTGELFWLNPAKKPGRPKGALGTVQSNGSLTLVLDGKTYMLHRVAWKMVNGNEPEQVLHLNHNKSDNRICNLTDDPLAIISEDKDDEFSDFLKFNDRRKKWGAVVFGVNHGWFPCRICATLQVKIALRDLIAVDKLKRRCKFEAAEAEKRRIAESIAEKERLRKEHLSKQEEVMESLRTIKF